jgi:hypothetical protein
MTAETFSVWNSETGRGLLDAVLAGAETIL